MGIPIWKSISGYNEKYHISSNGRIKSFKKQPQGKILAYVVNKDGYVQTMFSKDGKTKNFLVHRLVAISFIPNPHNLPEVNHLDGDKTNNNDWNLEWSTTKKNIQHSWATGLTKVVWGNKGNAGKKINVFNLKGELIHECRSLAQAKRKTKVSVISIKKCCNETIKTTKNLIFKFA